MHQHSPEFRSYRSAPGKRRAGVIVFALTILAIGGCDTPDPPHQATTQQIAQMNAEISGSGGSMAAAVDLGALLEILQDEGSAEERDFAFREFVSGTTALPPDERSRRLQELERVLRANREAR